MKAFWHHIGKGELPKPHGTGLEPKALCWLLGDPKPNMDLAPFHFIFWGNMGLRAPMHPRTPPFGARDDVRAPSTTSPLPLFI